MGGYVNNTTCPVCLIGCFRILKCIKYLTLVSRLIQCFVKNAKCFWIINIWRWRNVSEICDIEGGTSTLAIDLVKKYPKIKRVR